MMRRFFTIVTKLFFVGKRRSVPKNPRHIAVLKIGAIGDVLMTTPFLHHLRRVFPQAKITFIVGAWSRGVLQNNPNIDSVISFDDAMIWDHRWASIIRLVRRLRQERFDLAFVLDRHFSAALFAWISGMRFRVGFDRNGEGAAHNLVVRYGPVRHEIDYNLDLLRVLGFSVDDTTVMEAFPSEEDRRVADRFAQDHGVAFGRTIGIMAGGASNPGQEMMIRRWPKDHFVELISLLRKRYPNDRIVLFGGPSDATIHDELSADADSGVVNASGKLSLLQSIALMKYCTAFVTHDSGPMHMAAAAGIPVISIFGPVHPLRKAPKGGKHQFLWKPELPGALCDEEGKFPRNVTVLPCMDGVSAEMVLAAVARKITKFPTVEQR